MIGVKHHAAIDLIAAVEDGFERGEHFLDTKIGQVTEAAVVDPEHERVGVTYQPGGGDHRAVSPQHYYQVRLVAKLFVVDRIDIASRPVRIFAVHTRLSDKRDASFLEPFRELARGFPRLGMVRLYDDAHGFYLSSGHWKLK